MLKRIFRQCSQLSLILFANCKDSDPTLAWTEDDVSSKLKKAKLPNAAKAFKEHGISGIYFDQDTAELLDYIVGEGTIELKELKTLMDNLKREPKSIGDKQDRKISSKLKLDKVILDAVHGNIVLPPLCVNIIDTPQFQRLRNLKQMGATSFVYPGGTHTRFEHSLGVCYLAGLLVKQLREVHKDDKDIQIDDKDILCVQIAGLCHDMGHGPFSHMFDNKFLPSVRKEQNKEPIKHEQLSIKMIEHMFRDPANKLVTKFRDNDLKKKDLIFIKEQIYHPEDQQKRKTPCKEWTKQGRKQSKSFLYQIVSNEHNGVDVDKWDYLARDCLHLGLRSSFDHHRLIRFARIVKADNEYQICLRDKEIYNVYEMYHVRLSLQKWVWHHRVGAAIDLMLVDALTKVKNILKYPGKNGEDVPLAKCVDDMEAFTHLTDNIFQDILLKKGRWLLSCKDKRNLKQAQNILKSIERRKIYKFLYESPPLRCDHFKDKKTAEHEEDVKKEILKEGLNKEEQQILNDLCRVQLSKMDYGKNLRNPIRDLHVYSKDCPNIARPLEAHEVSRFVPQEEYCEMRFRVFILPNPNKDKKFKKLLEKVKSNADNYFKGKKEHKGNKCHHICYQECSANECPCKL